MTAPIWMAFPPEVHSALLSSGPGPGPLLASAGAWNSLSSEYADLADELSALVAGVSAGAWEGPSAESYLAANLPYVAWLLQAAADSTAMATQQETAATAYTSALAAVPALPELAANHAVHAVLLATNFFGINTIPVALNEADYARMWVQAATTMSTYQAVSTAAVAAAPHTTPAPQIVKADAAATTSTYPTQFQQEEMTFVDNLISEYLGYTHTGTLPTPINPTSATYPMMTYQQALTAIEGYYNTYVASGGELTPGEPLSYDLGKALFFINYTFDELLPGDIAEILHGNLSQIFSLETVAIAFSFVSMRISNVLEIINVALNAPLALVGAPLITAAPLPLVVGALAAAPVGAVGGFAGLAGLAGLPAPTVVPVAPSIPAPALAAPSAVAAPAPTPVAAPVPTPALGTPPPPAAAPPPALAGPTVGAGTGLENYAASYLVGGVTPAGRSSTKAAAKAPTADKAILPVVAIASAAEEMAGRRRRRRRKAQMLGRGYEYMDLEPEPSSGHDRVPTAVVADQGAGNLGFAGTVSKGTAQAVGLTSLAADEFGGGPSVPMLPKSWGLDGPEGEGGDS